MKAYDIKWDACEEDVKNLPKEVNIPNFVDADDVSDYLTESTGFPHYGFKLRDDYYSYETKHRCPKCNGSLRYTGSLNTEDYFQCSECGTEFYVEKKTTVINGQEVFIGYKVIKELKR